MKYQWLDEYLVNKPHVTKDYKEEWGWDRYLLNGKMVAAICTNKEDEDIITLKCEVETGAYLREQYQEITPGYYMNKVHWNSVLLDSNVPHDVIKMMIDQSYELIFSSLSKKIQKELAPDKKVKM